MFLLLMSPNKKYGNKLRINKSIVSITNYANELNNLIASLTLYKNIVIKRNMRTP